MSNIITKRRGFTLVEVVVVITIMAILMALSIVTINIVRKQSRNAKLRDDARTIAAGLEVYYTSHKKYPMFRNANNTGTLGVTYSYYDVNAYSLINGPTSNPGEALGELASSIPDPKPTNTSNGGMVCYKGTTQYTLDKPTEYYLWVIPEEKAAQGYKCGGWEVGVGYCAVANSKCHFTAAGKGDKIHCPSSAPDCDL